MFCFYVAFLFHSADELETRVCAYYGVSREPHLVQPKKVA